jgi:hypothetical protein
MGALSIPCSKKSSVYSEEDPGATSEKKGGQENATPETHLEHRNNRHRRVVVLFDKGANRIGNGVCGGLGTGTGTGTGTGSRALGGLNGRDHIAASVGCHVEDGVYAVWEQRKRVLRREEPDEGHSCGHRKVSRRGRCNEPREAAAGMRRKKGTFGNNSPRYWTFSSDKIPIMPPGYFAPTFCLARHVL